ncbi:DUF5688 family protein [Emergencia sp. 1XD21-10]|uniref:DUF5688 family protein n=1 Tax=Emergencia sp. 1XD21-10 TaxID=2304569 RepID=UPI00137A02E8|nr:DUF5688 family protein [Emergencia sp. 1XD21-10]NCF00466.1 hypothetical protein [Emergencia sp. 1XD21-10]
MKSFEEFKTEVMKWMQEKAKEQDYILSKGQNYKVNQQLDYVSLGKKQNPSCQPMVYVQDMYITYHEEMEKGDFSEKDIVKILLEEFWDMLTSHLKIAQNMADELSDAEKVKDMIICQLVNADRNKAMLRDLPHRDYLDLAIIYRIMFADGGSAVVTNDMAEVLGMKEEELYLMARKNLNRILPIMETRVGVDDVEMIFLTNASNLFGAATIMDTEKLEQIAEKYGTDLYIMPASIHELVITPVNWNRETLEVALWEANRSVIQPEIYLSDTLYRYDRATRTVRIA